MLIINDMQKYCTEGWINLVRTLSSETKHWDSKESKGLLPD